MPSDSYTLIISNIGVSTPSAGSVTNASVASDAAIAFSKLAALTSGNIIVGNGSNVPTSVALSGNVTLSNTGVATIANDAVTNAKIADNAVTNSKLANDAVTSNEIANDAVTNAKFANMATATIKGRITAGTGDPEDLTAVQTRTILGLDNVTNTSDANKPVSTAQQTAFDLKANLASPTFTGTVNGITKSMVGLANVDNTSDANKPVSTAQQTALNLKANIASPTFTGTASGTFSGPLTGNVTGNVSGSAVSFTGSLAGDVTGAQGATVIAPDSVTFAKMQDMSGYAILGKPTSGSGNVAEITCSSFMLEASTGLLRQSSATSARSTLGLVDAATGNALLSGGVGVAPAYGKVGLATHVSGTLPATSGGTGQTSYAIGDIPYASSSTALSKLSDVATGNALLSGGIGVAPAYGKVGLTTHVSGTLPVTSGGTGQTSYTIGDIPFANTSTTLSKLLDVATGNVLLSGGVGAAPTYGKVGLTTHVSGVLPIANGGAGDAILGNVLLSSGVSLPSTYGKVGLTTHVSGTLPAVNGGTGQTSYTIGDIPYASGATALSKLADVATGNALLSGGVGVAPAYGKVGLTTHVSGILPAENGGTGAAATGNVLLSGGVGVAPAYGKVGLTTHVSEILPVDNGGTGLDYAEGYLVGDGTSTLTTSLTIPVADISGTLTVTQGGTGQSSYTIGDIPFASSSSVLSKLADIATGNVLLSGGVGVAPAYGKVGLATHVSGTLPVANGGTGVTTSTGSGANALATSPILVTPVIGAATATSLAATGAITSSGTAGMGYATGAGGTVTQSTDKTTTVILNKTCGQITMNAASLAHDTVVSFTLTNSTIAAGDVLILNHVSGGTIGSYSLNAQCAAGSATINVRNIRVANVTLSEAIVIAFVVIKAVTA